MRRAAKRDTVEGPIIEALERIGCSPVVQHSGKDEPDLFVPVQHGFWIALEIKTPGGRLTEGQKAWSGPRYVATSVDAAVGHVLRWRAVLCRLVPVSGTE